jgi:hypothetical protein
MDARHAVMGEHISEIAIKVTSLDLEGATESVERLRGLPAADHVIVDFRELKWAEPFGMLYFGLSLRNIREQRRPARFSAANYMDHGYLSHMGFFQMFGLKYGNSPGEASGSNQYVPITSWDLNTLRQEAAAQREDVREVIERRASDFASLLTRETGTDLHTTLSYSLREVLRNVIEHSNSEKLWFVGQHWRNKHQVELVVADEGIGIRESLRRNPNLRPPTDLEAIRLALEPGISGVAYRGARLNRNDYWANSGYGLFMTSKLCALGGSFFVCSGSASLLWERGNEENLTAHWGGTLLRLGISTPEVRNLSERLKALREEGEKIAKQASYAANPVASLSAQLPPGNKR